MRLFPTTDIIFKWFTAYPLLTLSYLLPLTSLRPAKHHPSFHGEEASSSAVLGPPIELGARTFALLRLRSMGIAEFAIGLRSSSLAFSTSVGFYVTSSATYINMPSPCAPLSQTATFGIVAKTQPTNSSFVTSPESVANLRLPLPKVAIAPWGTPALLGAGMIIYPVQNSSSLLVGALFFERPFPDFLGLNSPVVPLGPAIPAVPPMYPQTQAPPYSQGMTPATASSSSSYHHHHHHPHSQSGSPHRSDPNSPVDPATASRSQDQAQYQQYMMSYGQRTTSSSSPTGGSSGQWTGEMQYPSGSGYPTQQNPGQYP